MPVIKHQQQLISANITHCGEPCRMTVTLRHDDSCGNGHNTFSITADIKPKHGRGGEMGGCIHDEIREYFPELAYLIPWHLCSTDGPLHYVANTTYHASDTDWRGEPKTPDIDRARRCAIWPDATLEQLQSVDALNARLDGLLAEFRRTIEALGMVY